MKTDESDLIIDNISSMSEIAAVLVSITLGVAAIFLRELHRSVRARKRREELRARVDTMEAPDRYRPPYRPEGTTDEEWDAFRFLDHAEGRHVFTALVIRENTINHRRRLEQHSLDEQRAARIPPQMGLEGEDDDAAPKGPSS